MSHCPGKRSPGIWYKNILSGKFKRITHWPRNDGRTSALCRTQTCNIGCSHLLKGIKQHFCFYSVCLSSVLFFNILRSFLFSTPSHFFYSRLSLSLSVCFPPLPHSSYPCRLVCSVRCVVNMHSPFLLLYYCPTGGGGPFLWPDNGRRRDREHGGHVPFATLRYLSILPPFSPAGRFWIAP